MRKFYNIQLSIIEIRMIIESLNDISCHYSSHECPIFFEELREEFEIFLKGCENKKG